MQFVRGWASTSIIDAVDLSFEPDAIRLPSFGGLTPPIELLYNHDRFSPAGKIITLERRATKDGSVGLWIEAITRAEAEAHFGLRCDSANE